MSTIGSPAGDPVAPPPPPATPRLRGWDLMVLAALGALAAAPLVVLLVRVWDDGGVFAGGDGFLVADPLQYLNWLRQIGAHGAAGNLYDLAPGPRTFVHPLLAISGLLHRLGIGVAGAYYVWLPVGVAALFWGAFRLAGRFLPRSGDRRLAVVCALFFATPAAALVGWTGLGGYPAKFQLDFAGGELWSVTYLWGYLFTAVAVGLMPLGLLAYERGRAGRSPRALVLTGAIGLLVAWLQPWQGITMAFVLVGAEAVVWWWPRRIGGRDAARPARGAPWGAVRDLLGPLVAIGLPLVYYLVLSKTDDAWRLAGVVNDIGHWPLWVTVVSLAPLALPAAFAYRLPAPDFGAIALRAWPLAGLVVFYQPLGTFPAHAFQGLALPLAVLGVLAVRRAMGTRTLSAWWAWLIVLAVLVVPGTVYRAEQLLDAFDAQRQPFILTTGERDALRSMERSPLPGGVLAPVYSGLLVPAYTGRESWIGAGSWTPDFATRERATEDLLAGRLSPAAAQRLVREVGPRFVYADCHDRADITADLGAVVTGPPRRFGCARVWQVRPAYVRELG